MFSFFKNAWILRCMYLQYSNDYLENNLSCKVTFIWVVISYFSAGFSHTNNLKTKFSTFASG